MGTAKSKDEMTPSQHITQQIAELAGWRGIMLARLRQLVLEADPNIIEEWKWDTAVWAQNGLVCSAGAFKDHLKLNFFKGAALQDPNGLFNAGLDARTSRAIDFVEGDQVDEAALSDLIRSAVAYNLAGSKKK